MRWLALAAERDEDRRWDALRDLVRLDPARARESGERGLASTDAVTKQVAADLLGAVASAESSAAPAIASALMAALDGETTATVLDALITALGHTADSRARSVVLRYIDHPDQNVRFAVTWSLPPMGLDDDALAALRRLSADADADVRDWATFGLAESDATDPATVDALIARVEDPDNDARAEAIFGLARRKDPRARELIEREMAKPVYGTLIDRALEELGG